MAPLKKKVRDFIYRFRSLPDYYGNEFKEIYSFLQFSRWWSRERIKNYKLEKLKDLVLHAERNVPYYRDLFNQHGIEAWNIKTFEDFSRIPILTKKNLKNNLEKFKATDFDSYHTVVAKTSATSGGETILYRSAYLESFRKAVLWRVYHECGFSFGDKKANITNPQNFDPDAPVYEYDRLENELIIDTAHLLLHKFDKTYEALRNFQPRLIWSHPNMLGLLAEYILEKNLEPLEIPLIATYAAKFDPALKPIVQKAIKGRYFEYYGNRENTIAAWGDSDGVFFEVSEYCHFEIDGQFPAGEGQRGDLITTSLHNYAFPLIRYHSEDLVEWLGDIDPSKPYPALRLIGGRGKDLLVSKNGLIDVPVLSYLQKNDFDKIKSYQIEQISRNKLIFRAVVRDNFDFQADNEKLRKLIFEILSEDFNIEIKYVDEIKATARGKSRMVISPLALDYLHHYNV